jgi:hypothetical protein
MSEKIVCRLPMCQRSQHLDLILLLVD